MKVTASVLLVLFLFNCKASCQSEFNAFQLMRDGYNIMAFISSSSSKRLTTNDWKSLQNALNAEGLLFQKNIATVPIANNNIATISTSRVFLNKNTSESILIEDFSTESGLMNRWMEIRAMVGAIMSIQNNNKGVYYLKREDDHNHSLNITSRTDKYIINIKLPLPFDKFEIEDWSAEEKALFTHTNNKLKTYISLLEKHLVSPKDHIYKAAGGRILTQKERLFGLFTFWHEVDYNFAFFDQVPDLDWQQTLYDYIPIISAEQSNLEYYKNLEKLCALLNDGHTNVYYPDDLMNNLAAPPVLFTEIDAHIYLTNFDKNLDGELSLGLELTSINDFTVSEYLGQFILPYISSSTDYIKRKQSIKKMLVGKDGSKVKLGFRKLTGESFTVEVSRTNEDATWVREVPDLDLVRFEKKEATGIIQINSFGNRYVVSMFEQYLDSIINCQNLIIDLRNNGGGNSGYGYDILKYFSKKPIITSKWKTREHKAAYKAWGSNIEKVEDLDDWETEAKKTAQGDYWYESSPDTILSQYEQIIDMPIMILIGNQTASAAEDFLVAAESISLGKTVGDYTFGSTGQPLSIRLPGGGSARICTKRDVYADGKEFVGYGIPPDYPVKVTIEDLLSDRDSVLEYAIHLLKTSMQ